MTLSNVGRLLALAGALAAIATPTLAEGPRLEGTRGSDLKVEPLSLTPVPTEQNPGRPVPYDLRARVTNDGFATLDDLYLALEARTTDGQVRSFSGFPVRATFEPGRTQYIGVLVRGLAVAPGDTVHVGPWEEASSLMAEGVLDPLTGEEMRSHCAVWCDLCFSRAAAVCLCGVESANCQCSSGSHNCSFSCQPCPE